MTVPVSIVVLASNDRRALESTLESLDAQQYPALDVVVELSEPSAGEALNRGFDRAAGAILGYLRAGDILLPRAVHRVSAEVAPDRGRHAVMGGSLFVVEGVGVDHPAEYLGRFEHLAIWKRGIDTVAMSSLFWHRSVLERARGFMAGQQHEVDYDFACRLGALHPIHKVDTLWSARPLVAVPPLASESEALADCIRISRRYWGSWLRTLRWRCEASHWRYQWQLHEQARHHARRAEALLAEGRVGAARIEQLKTWIREPRMAQGRFS